MIKFRKILYFVIFLLGLWGASCKKSGSVITQSIGGKATTSASSGAGGLALSVQMVDEITYALMSSGGMNQSEVAPIRSGGLAGLGLSDGDANKVRAESNAASSSSSFNLAGEDSYRVDKSAALIMAGMTQAMSSADAGLGDDAAKLSVVGLMTKTMFSSLNSKLTDVPEDSQTNLPGLIAAAAISSLDEAGVSSDKIAEGVGSIVSETVSGLKSAGFDTNKMSKAFGKITSESVKGMKDAGVSTKNFGTAVQAMMKGAVGSLGNTGIPQKDLGPQMQTMIKGAVESFDDFGIKPSQVGNVVDDAVKGAVVAFASAGVPATSDGFTAVMDDVVGGAMSGMAGAGVGDSYFAETMTSVMSSAVSSLGEAGMNDPGAIQAISSDITSKSIDFIDDFGISDPIVIKNASLKIAEGVMGGIGALKNAGTFSAAEMTDMAAAVQTSGVSAMKQQNDVFGFGSAGDLPSLFSTGIMTGLSAQKVTTSELASMTSSLAAAGSAALLSTGVDSATALGSEATMITAANSWIEEMSIRCVQEKGVWRGDWCEYPLAAPVDGGNQPTLAEEDACIGAGGFIMFTPDGNWFCDSVGQLAGAGGEADCIATGFYWKQDLEGNYFCDSLPPTGCGIHVDSASCNGASGCVYNSSNVCVESSLVLCSDLAEAQCNTAGNGCVWSSSLAYCRNATAISCGSFQGNSASCLAEPGCSYLSNGDCVNSASSSDAGDSCSTIYDQPTCDANFNCEYGGGVCYVSPYITCPSYHDSAGCSADSACSWNSGGGFCEVDTTPVSSGANVCSGFSSASCIASFDSTGASYCVYDYGNSACYDINLPNTCSTATTSPTCTALGVNCNWDSTTLACYDSYGGGGGGGGGSPCDAMVTSPTCTTTFDSMGSNYCYWDNTMMTCYDGSESNACSSHTTSATCTTETMETCSFDYTSNICYRSASGGGGGGGSPCDAMATSPTCTTTYDSMGSNYCYWDSSMMTCYDSSESNACSSHATSAMCTTETMENCAFDYTLNICYRDTSGGGGGGGSPCDAMVTSPTCTTTFDSMGSNYCYWDSSMMTCYDSSESNACSSHTTSAMCTTETMENCAFDYTLNICYRDTSGGGGGSPCDSQGTSATCTVTYDSMGSLYCKWDSSMMTCYDSSESNACTSHATSATCTTETMETCAFDTSLNICYRDGSNGAGPCDSPVTSPTCTITYDSGGMSYCNWDSSLMKCYDSYESNVCSSHTTSAMCTTETMETCAFDSALNICYRDSSSGSPSCSSYDGNQPNCINNGCFYDAAMCYDSSMASSILSTKYNQIDCNFAGGMWDGVSCNMPTMGGSCSTQVTQGTCDTTFNCTWNGSTCQDIVHCNDYVTQPTCDSMAICSWNATNGQCNSDGPSFCSSISGSSNCDAMTPFCSWGSTTCDYTGPTDCGATYIGDSTGCNADPQCQWGANGSCHSIGTAVCSLFDNFNADCQQSFSGCVHSGSTCNFIGPPNCQAYVDSPSCTGVSWCSWNGSICEVDKPSFCPTLVNQTECDAVPGFCTWNATTCDPIP